MMVHLLNVLILKHHHDVYVFMITNLYGLGLDWKCQQGKKATQYYLI